MKIVLHRDIHPAKVIYPWKIKNWDLEEKTCSPKGWHSVVPDMDELGWQIDWYLEWERNSK